MSGLDHRGTAPECAWNHGGAAVRGEETALPCAARLGSAGGGELGRKRRRGCWEGMLALATRWAN
jgi:hypothetical protein